MDLMRRGYPDVELTLTSEEKQAIRSKFNKHFPGVSHGRTKISWYVFYINKFKNLTTLDFSYLSHRLLKVEAFETIFLQNQITHHYKTS
jgi:hypothetical protein